MQRAGLISNAITKGTNSSVGDSTVQFNAFTPAGTGLGIDIGATGVVMKFIKVGISFTDIGSISWSKNVVYTRGDTTISFGGFSPAYTNVPGSESNLDSIKNAFNDYFKDRDTVGSSFSTPLPTKMNIGASMMLNDLVPAIPGKLLVAIDYHQGLNNSLNNSTTPEIIFGAEWKPAEIFALRTGIGFGGEYGFRWSAGFGIEDFDIGLGTLNALVDPVDAKNIAVTFSFLKFRF